MFKLFLTLPTTKQQITAPVAMLILATLAFIFDQSLSPLLNYQRDSIGDGEIWRLLTAHFFHTNTYHLLLNLAALVMLWALHGHFYRVNTYLYVFGISSIISALGIHYFSLDIRQYVGLSGTLHGIFMWGALLDIANKEKTGYLLLFGGWAKIVHEQVYGASGDVAELISAKVAIDAHLFGAIAGCLTGAYALYQHRNKHGLENTVH